MRCHSTCRAWGLFALRVSSVRTMDMPVATGSTMHALVRVAPTCQPAPTQWNLGEQTATRERYSLSAGSVSWETVTTYSGPALPFCSPLPVPPFLPQNTHTALPRKLVRGLPAIRSRSRDIRSARRANKDEPAALGCMAAMSPERPTPWPRRKCRRATMELAMRASRSPIPALSAAVAKRWAKKWASDSRHWSRDRRK